MRNQFYTPFRELSAMAEQMNKFFKTFSNENENSEERQKVDFRPLVDISESDTEIIFEIELPGVDKNDVKATISENVLIIKGSKKSGNCDEKNICCRAERTYGDFYRSFMLPESADSEKISAKFDNGVLFITIPKREPETPKKVDVEIK